jgi:DNA mismatch endonuclease (patch repair protein)
MRERTKPYSVPDELRSRIMRSNKSHGNLSTELSLVRLMRVNRISGWRRRVLITGRPDFVFKPQRVALFIDGCYWHGCKCRRLPKKNRRYWQEKFEANQARDARVTRQLRAEGWNVLRFWEHQIKKEPQLVMRRIARALANLPT